MHGGEKYKMRIGVLALFLIGMPQHQIAKLYGVSRQRINQILYGVKNTNGELER